MLQIETGFYIFNIIYFFHRSGNVDKNNTG